MTSDEEICLLSEIADILNINVSALRSTLTVDLIDHTILGLLAVRLRDLMDARDRADRELFSFHAPRIKDLQPRFKR